MKKIAKRFTKPMISVIIPVFQAESFICETLDSLNEQIYQNFEIIISIDKSDDETELVIRRWCNEHKNIDAQIFCQTHRLGMVRNVNFLLEKCQTKYFMIMPHDDLLEKTYLQKLIKCQRTNPQASITYSDIQGFGIKYSIRTQKSIRGNKFERTLEYLTYCVAAIPFRGLVNRTMLSDPILLFENDYFEFAADTIWVIQLAMKGELIRIPEVLYHKRFHVDSLFNHSNNMKNEDKTKAWVEHCKDCLRIIFREDFDEDELIRLIEAIKSRLLQDIHPLWSPKLIRSNDRAMLLCNLEKTIEELYKVRNKSNSQISSMKQI